MLFQGSEVPTWLSQPLIRYVFVCSKFVLPSFDSIIQDSASQEIVESTSYTLKEINTVTSCSIYSATALCTPDVWNL